MDYGKQKWSNFPDSSEEVQLNLLQTLTLPLWPLQRPGCWVPTSDLGGGCSTSIRTKMKQISIISENFTVTFISLYRHNPESFPFTSLLSSDQELLTFWNGWKAPKKKKGATARTVKGAAEVYTSWISGLLLCMQLMTLYSLLIRY